MGGDLASSGWWYIKAGGLTSLDLPRRFSRPFSRQVAVVTDGRSSPLLSSTFLIQFGCGVHWRPWSYSHLRFVTTSLSE